MKALYYINRLMQQHLVVFITVGKKERYINYTRILPKVSLQQRDCVQRRLDVANL
jgi:hypothetical protein